MEITINNKKYGVKYGFKALMIYEKIEDHSFTPENISDILIFFYCCILATNAELTFDDFIEAVDEEPELLQEFNTYLNNVIEAKTLKKVQEKENK